MENEAIAHSPQIPEIKESGAIIKESDRSDAQPAVLKQVDPATADPPVIAADTDVACRAIAQSTNKRKRKARTIRELPKQSDTKSKRKQGNSRESEKSKAVTEKSIKSVKRKATEKSTPAHKKIETRIRGQVKRLRYELHFVEAYESEGWNRANIERIKPKDGILAAKEKVVRGKRSIVHLLKVLQDFNKSDRQFQYLAPENSHLLKSPSGEYPLQYSSSKNEEADAFIIYCSRCLTTSTAVDNDIIICDMKGCNRAYHQQCQSPPVLTVDIPLGDTQWFCEICSAIFTCLRSINSVCGTAYESVDEVFPELLDEEKALHREQGEALRNDQAASSWLDSMRTSGIGTSVQEESTDEDYTLADIDKESDLSNSEEELAGGTKKNGRYASITDGEISDGEVAFLEITNVIDPHRRSMRSSDNAKYSAGIAAPSTASTELNHSHLEHIYMPYEDNGQMDISIAGKTSHDSNSSYNRTRSNSTSRQNNFRPMHSEVPYHDDVQPSDKMIGKELLKIITLHTSKVYGVVVDRVWKVKYEDGTEEFLTWNELHCAIEKADEAMESQKMNREIQLPLPKKTRAKRNRTMVNYRELNTLLFADTADSDEEAQDQTFKTRRMPISKPSVRVNEVDRQNSSMARRSTRAKKSKNYRSLHEGRPAE